MMYEVVTTQMSNGKGRVIHEEFSDYDVARQYAHDMVVDDPRTVGCSIYKNDCLVMDVL